MTWWLWLVLVVAALATFALIAVHLWRRARRFFAAAGEAGELMSELVDHDAPGTPLAPPVLADPAQLLVAWEKREANLLARQQRRWRRAETARERWHRVGLRG